jgi:aspartate/methionine/tyrosine aminotransferase
VIVITPCYESLITIPQAIGTQVTSIILDSKKDWKLDLEVLRAAFRNDTKLLILNYPHNPTGTLVDRKVFDEMIDLARAKECFIFCDEVYRYMEFDEQKRLPSIADAYEKGIALNAMTKAFGLAGLRIGWLASRNNQFMQKASAYKVYLSICNSAPSEILALIALRAKEALLKRNREIILRNLTVLDEFMQRHRHQLAWVRPQSGTIAFLELLLPISIEEFAEQLVEKTGVLIMPGSIFDVPGNFFRIGFGRKNMPEILERFERHLNSI